MRWRLIAPIALVACVALGLLAYRWTPARCDERRLSAALAGLGEQIRRGEARIDVTAAGWRQALADTLAGLARDADGGRSLDLYADASVRGEVLLAIAEEAARADVRLTLIVATGHPYAPLAELPISFGSGDRVVVAPELPLAALAPELSRFMGQPCCPGTQGATCPRPCAHATAILVRGD